MRNWRDTLVSPQAPMIDSLRALNESALQICLVVDSGQRLLGTVTDGDIRRGILRGLPLETPVAEVMNLNPFSIQADVDRGQRQALLKVKGIHQVPLVDSAGRVVGLETVDDLLATEACRDNWVVLMAGGEGQRLRPLTDDIPKPLLPVGSKPILETIIDSFIDSGFRKFFLSVNYKAELVERHFGDGSSRGVEIRYLREDTKLGTAGALALLPERPSAPIFVMNGDILTNVEFANVLNFHHDHNAVATMCVREYVFEVPYGVVDLDDHHLVRIDEKPLVSNFVNAGIYVLSPEALDLVPKDGMFNMTQLFERCIENGKECVAFPIREYWVDVGQIGDFRRANNEFEQIFGGRDTSKGQ